MWEHYFQALLVSHVWCVSRNIFPALRYSFRHLPSPSLSLSPWMVTQWILLLQSSEASDSQSLGAQPTEENHRTCQAEKKKQNKQTNKQGFLDQRNCKWNQSKGEELTPEVISVLLLAFHGIFLMVGICFTRLDIWCGDLFNKSSSLPWKPHLQFQVTSSYW